MKKIFFLLAGILLFTKSINAQTIYYVSKTGDYNSFLYQYNYVDSLCDTTMYGTLQWAVRKANDTPGPCEIHFAIPGAGPHTIFLSYELPVLINTIKVDGTTQSGYQYGQPSVILDGQNLISTGIYYYNIVNPVVKGLRIQNFTIQGILFNQCRYGEISENIITGISNGASLDATTGIRLINTNNIHFNGNYIGTDFSESSGMGCDDYGILVQIYASPQQINGGNNFIGGSGLGQGNIIAYNGVYGIWIAQSANNLISRNRLFNNPVAIRLTQKANQNIQPPVIISVTNGIVSGTSTPNDIIEIFGSTGDENANEYLGTTQADSTGVWEITGIVTSYNSIVATATDTINSTSYLSNSLLTKPPCTLYLEAGGTFCVGTNIYLWAEDWQHCDIEAWYFIERSWLPIGYCFQFGNYVNIPAPNSVGTYEICLYYVGYNNTNCNGYPVGQPINCITINVLPEPSISPIIASDTYVCPGEPVSLSVTSVNVQGFIWRNPQNQLLYDGNAVTITPYVSGTWCVTGKNFICNYETEIECVYVEVGPTPTITFNSIIPACQGGCNGSVTLIGTGGVPPYTYELVGVQTNTNGIFNNLCAGDYTINVTGGNGCSVSGVVNISEVPIPSVIINNVQGSCPNICNGSVTLSGAGGGGAPYTYQWPGLPGNTTGIFENLCSGIYTVTVSGSNGCTVTANIEIPNAPTIEIPVFQYNPECACDGYINIHAPIGCTFNWSHDANLNSSTAENLCPGTYHVTITEQNGCVSPYSFDIISTIPYLNGGQPIVLTTPQTTLNQSGNVYGDIIVPANYTLNIQNCTLKFQPGKKIILSNNSILHIDNSVLTNIAECDSLWGGITSVFSYQPLQYINVIVNSSIIENAVTGINIRKVQYLTLNTTGSFYNRTRFRNNSYDIKIFYSQISVSIDNTDFTTDDYLLAPYTYPSYHIYLETNQNTVYITNTNFENTTLYDPNISIGLRGYGILANKSDVSVSSFCRFTGLSYGIRARGILTVTQSGFFNNHRGILAETSHSNAIIKGNTIEVGNTGNLLYTPNTYTYGVQIANCNVFRVEDNGFKDGFIGLTTFNTTTGIKVYKNSFLNLFAGFVANGQNNLVLNCNQFINNGNNAGYTYSDGSQVPPWGGDMVISNGKINTIQEKWDVTGGSTWNSIINTFCGSLSNVFKFNNNTTTLYTYKFCTTNDPSDISNCKSSNVTASPDPFLIPFNSSNYNANCQIIPLLLNKPVESVTRTADSLYYLKNNLQNLLINLVDDGNTEYFIELIQNLKPNNFTQFYNTLMNISPYLSDTVLISFMVHPINKPAHKKNVVEACSPLPYKVRLYIDQMNVNQNFKNQLWALQTTNDNARVHLENQISSLDVQRQSEINDLVLDCIFDTLGAKTDSVINYLSNSNLFDDHKYAFNLLTDMERYSEAQLQISAMDLLKSEFPAGKQQEIIDYLFVTDIYLKTLQQPDSITDSLISINSSSLLAVANSEFHYAQDDARALLEQIGFDFPRNVYLNEIVNKNSRVNSPVKSIQNTGISIFPNPAADILQIVFNGNPVNLIEIKDITSKTVKAVRIKESSEDYRLDLSVFANGVYFICFKNNGLTIENKQFVISR